MVDCRWYKFKVYEKQRGFFFSGGSWFLTPLKSTCTCYFKWSKLTSSLFLFGNRSMHTQKPSHSRRAKTWCSSRIMFWTLAFHYLHAQTTFQIVEHHLPQVHCYADDTQLYVSFSPDRSADADFAIKSMTDCINDIRSCMISDNLLLNDVKTEFLIIFFTGTPATPKRTPTTGLKTWNWFHRHNIVRC